MSCCPGLRCKNTGSGYVKPDGSSDSARELDKRMEEMLKARSLQDAGVFAPVTRPASAIPATPLLVYGAQANLNTPQNTQLVRK